MMARKDAIQKENPSSGSKTLVFILSILLFTVGIAAIYFGYVYFTDKGAKETEVVEESAGGDEEGDVGETADTDDRDTDEVVDEVADEEEEVADSTCTVPDSWEQIDNTSQGYTAYRPSSWYYRFFGSTMETFGIDPNEIPEVSEYAGVITLNRMQTTMTEYISSLIPGYSDTTETIGENEWNIIDGTEEESELFGEREARFAFTEADSREFVVIMVASDTADYEDEFNNFLCSVSFWE